MLIKRFLSVAIILFFVVGLCGCEKKNTSKSDTTPTQLEKYITVDNKNFSIDEINRGIKDTFNCVLYYYGDDSTSEYITSNKSLVLNQELNYELYFDPNENLGDSSIISQPKIYFVITNIKHPLSAENDTKFYAFGIDVTQYGLCSDFSVQAHFSQEEYSFMNDEYIYLGSYSFCIDEIQEPSYKEKDDEWKSSIEKAIKLYMDENDFYSDADKNLKTGTYNVYVKNFLESDIDSKIIFENENGDIYEGLYYFVQNVSENNPADLNHVELVGEHKDSDSYKAYLEKVKTNPAISIKYKTGDDKTGDGSVSCNHTNKNCSKR